MRCVVTGGAGFIGSHLVDNLLDIGVKIRVYDNLTTGCEENVNSEAEFIYGDIRNTIAFDKALENCDTIFHLAAFTSVPESFTNEQECIDINQVAFYNMLSCASRKNIKKIILSSTSAVFPDDQMGPFNEQSVVSPTSPYGKSKLYDEKILKQWCSDNKERTGIALRYFNVYGSRQEADSDYASVIPKFLKRIDRGQPIFVYGNGSQTRDYIHVSDIVSANIRVINLQSFNHFVVGTGIEISVNDMVELIKKITKKKIEIKYQALPPGDALRSCADITQLKTYGWEPTVEINEGLLSTWESISLSK